MLSTTSLICTIGPSCSSPDVLLRLKKAGVDIFRINMSHASLDDIPRLFEIASKLNIVLGIDTEGAQLRTKLSGVNNLNIQKDDIVYIGDFNTLSDRSLSLSLYPESVYSGLKIGTIIRVDFNGALVKIVDVDKGCFKCVALGGGLVGNNKGADIMYDYIDLPDFTDKDLKALSMANSLGINNIFVSFCKSPDAIKRVRSLNPDSVVTSKIESKLSIHSLEGICADSDAILIDRGDLTREISILDIPFAQRGIIHTANKFGKPCYVATNVLESLINGNLPTRAEINDIVGTLQMGASGLVLAAETAIGKKPVLCAEIITELIHKNKLYESGLLFADIDRQEITDPEMTLWLNRFANH